MDVSGEGAMQPASGGGEGGGGAAAATAAPPTYREVSQVNAADWPARGRPRVTDRPRIAGFQAVVARSALNDMHRHGRSEPGAEVCGVLVGNVYRDAHGPYLHVEASIRGTHAAGKATQVTFTAETWNHINDELERRFPGRRILGWYHTHPGFGIFLSDMDRFIHNNFFPEPWQVAYVYDPLSEEDGLFMWKRGMASRGEYVVDPDAPNTDPPREPRQGEPTTATLSELAGRVQWLERQVKWLAVGLCVAAALAVAAPLLTYALQPSAEQPALAPGPAGAGEPGPADEPYIPPSLRPPPSSTAEGAGVGG